MLNANDTTFVCWEGFGSLEERGDLHDAGGVKDELREEVAIRLKRAL